MKISSDYSRTNDFLSQQISVGIRNPAEIMKLTSPTSVLATFDFDQGSYSSFAKVSTDVYRITPIKHWSNTWAWWALKSKKFSGKTPHFLINKADHYNMSTGEWLACWSTSYDTDTWYQFDNVTIGAVDLEFYNDTAFPSGTIYISALPMYPFSRVERKMSEWSLSSLVGDTTSTTSNIIDYMTSRPANDGTGRICPALPLYGMKISNSTANTKNKIILSAFQHPSETPGAYALEGSVDWLLSTSWGQKFLLDWFDFYVYPCRNPQAVQSGYFRVGPHNNGNVTDWTTNGVFENIDIMKPAILADISNSADVMLDYHSYMSSIDINGVVVNGDTTGQYPLFANSMETLDTAFELTEAAVGAEDGTLGKLLKDDAGVDLYVTMEQGGTTARSITDWKNYGANIMKSLVRMESRGEFPQGPGIGSRDFNGTTDRIDWDSVSNLTGHPLTISFWMNPDAVTANGYIVAIHTAGDTGVGFIVNMSDATNKYIGFLSIGTANLQRSSVTGGVVNGEWNLYTITWNGVQTDFTGIHIYRNGVELAYSTGINGATQTAATGSWSIGGRKTDDLRNINGKLAQVGVWDRVLTTQEIANLVSGYAPELVPSGLLFYYKGNTSSLAATPGGTGTADGTTQVTGVGNGPPIIYG